MIKGNLVYYRTEIPVLLGDRVRYNGIFHKKEGTVVYVPGQSELNRELEYDDVRFWAIQLDEEPGDIRQLGYFPDHTIEAPKKIEFLCRGDAKNRITQDDFLS